MSSIKDVAALSGVSVPTVYKVFSNTYTTSDEVRKKVLAAAQELSYTPKSLKDSKIKKDNQQDIIGVVVGSVLNSFFNRLIDVLTKEFERYQFRVVALYCNDDVDQMVNNLELLEKLNVKAIIFEPMTNERFDVIYRLQEKKVVMLQLFNMTYPEIDVLKFDDEAGTYLATKQLIKCGHRNITMFYKRWDLCPDREPGYRRAFEEFSIPLVEENLCKMDYVGSIRNIIRQKITTLQPTAIISVNEAMTVNVIQTLNEMNLSIPGDISLIVYDDLPWIRAYNITAIAHPFEQIASSACEIILNRIKQRMDNEMVNKATVLVIDPVLISRSSIRILDSFIN